MIILWRVGMALPSRLAKHVERWREEKIIERIIAKGHRQGKGGSTWGGILVKISSIPEQENKLRPGRTIRNSPLLMYECVMDGGGYHILSMGFRKWMVGYQHDNAKVM